MSSKGLGTLTLNLVAKTAGFTEGLSKAERELQSRSQRMQKTAKGVGLAVGTAMRSMLSLAIPAGVGASVGAFTKQIADAGAQLQYMSKIANTTSQDLQKWAVGASTMGISQEKLTDQLKDFNEKLGEFQQTGGGGMKDFFLQIAPQVGITAAAFRGLSGTQGLQLYYDSLEKAGLSQEKMSFYLESMASDTTALIPLLKNGGEGFKKWGDEAERMGSILGDDTLGKITEFKEESLELDRAMVGLKIVLADALLPAITDLVSEFAGYISEGGRAEEISSILVEGVTSVADAFVSLKKEVGLSLKFLKEANYWLGALREAMADSEKFAQRLFNRSPVAKMLGRYVDYSNVTGGSAGSVPDFGGVTGGSYGSVSLKPAKAAKPAAGGSGKQRAAELTEEQKAAQRLTESYEQMRDSMRERIALFGVETEAAKVSYGLQFGALKDLDQARKNELISLAKQQDMQRSEQELMQRLNEKDQERLRTQEDAARRAQETISGLQDEYNALFMTNEEREKYNALRYAGVDAASKEGEAIKAMVGQIQEARKLRELADDAGAAFTGMFADISSGTVSAKDAMKNFLKDLTEMLVRFMIQKAVTQFINSFAGGYSDGGTFGTAQKFANGGAFTNGIYSSPTLFKFANGGKFGVMGEAGPEAVMPLARDSQGRLGVRGGGGSQTSVTINQSFSRAGQGGGDQKETSALARRLNIETEATVRRVLQQESRQGGMIWRQANG